MALAAKMSWCINLISVKDADEKNTHQTELCIGVAMWVFRISITDDLQHNFITMRALASTGYLYNSAPFAIKWDAGNKLIVFELMLCFRS